MPILHRLFFGIRPPRAIADDMAALPLANGWPRRPNRADRIHMTLALTPDFLNMPLCLIEAFHDVGSSIAIEPFRLIFDRAVASENLLVLLPSEKLPHVGHFQKQLAEKIARAGLPLRKNVRFNPHITLSYQRGVPFDRAVESYSWLVEDFVLIHSHVGLTRHDLVGHWKLGSRPVSARGYESSGELGLLL